ncbi:MAG: helix-turn-helix transcriptional regulator [Suipraeoptans sp.]
MHNYLNSIYSITGIPILCFDCRSGSFSYSIGSNIVPSVEKHILSKLTEQLKVHNPLIIYNNKNRERLIYAMAVIRGKIVTEIIFLAQGDSIAPLPSSNYLNILNLISMFLHGIPLQFEQDIKEIILPDEGIWFFLYGKSQAENPELTYITYFIEKRILRSVRSGNLHTLRTEILEYLPIAMRTLYLDAWDLRSKKNAVVALTTLVFLEAVGGGLPTKDGLSLLLKYQGIIEKITNFSTIDRLIEEMLISFCKKVQVLKMKNLSYPTYYCIDYVKSNISNKIKLEDIAEKLKLNPSYLSTVFKEEYGMNFSTYVISEKIEEAKKLILFSDKSISEIASMLSFSDQSHFSRNFKQYTGHTPRQYRQQHA